MAQKATHHWAQLEALLEEWEVPFELVEEFAVADIKVADYSQVRDPGNRSPKENVEQYALQMANGAQFPPVVLAANDKAIIDGNTRVAAARRNGYEKIAVYLVNPANAKMTRAIGAALNMTGGSRLLPGELEKAARDYVEAGFMDAEIARRLGRTAEWARKFRKRDEFAKRTETNPAAKSIRPAVAEKLTDIHLDAPFQIVVDATKDIKIDRPTADKIVQEIESARSEREAIETATKCIAELRPLNQARATREPKDSTTNRALKKLVEQCQQLQARIESLDVPMVEPLAGQYRATLIGVRSAIDGLIARLPQSDAA